MEEKKPNTPRNSTVAVSPEIGKKLERFLCFMWYYEERFYFPFVRLFSTVRDKSG